VKIDRRIERIEWRVTYTPPDTRGVLEWARYDDESEAMAVATALNQTPDVFSVSVETRKVVYAPELNNDLFQNSVTL
jgi:hypothetical protein